MVVHLFSSNSETNEVNACVRTLCHHRHRRQRLRQRKAAGLLVGRDALNMELVKERYDVVEG